MTIELEYIDGEYYEIDFRYTKGSLGDYYNAPEPHKVEIEAIYNGLFDLVENKEIYEYFNQEIYDLIDRGELD